MNRRRRDCRRLAALATLAALAVALAWGATSAAAGEVDLSHRVAVSAEYDDNVYKAGRDLVADELGRLFYDFGLTWRMTRNNALLTSYQLGGKLYFHEGDEDTAINQLWLGYVNTSIPAFEIGASVGARLRNVRDAQEDYFKDIARVTVGRHFGDSFFGGVSAEYSEFNFRGTKTFDYWTQRYGGEARYDYGRAFSAGLTYDFERKTYPYDAYQNIGESDVILSPTDQTRTDDLQEIGASLRYQRSFFETLPFLGSFDYLLQLNRSNSYGDSYNNHRFTLGLSQGVYEDLSLHFLGVFQTRSTTDKVLIPHSYSIEETDENYNQVEIRLTYGINDYLTVHGGWRRYWSRYPHNEVNFTKNLYAVGLSASF